MAEQDVARSRHILFCFAYEDAWNPANKLLSDRL